MVLLHLCLWPVRIVVGVVLSPLLKSHSMGLRNFHHPHNTIPLLQLSDESLLPNLLPPINFCKKKLPVPFLDLQQYQNLGLHFPNLLFSKRKQQPQPQPQQEKCRLMTATITAYIEVNENGSSCCFDSHFHKIVILKLHTNISKSKMIIFIANMKEGRRNL